MNDSAPLRQAARYLAVGFFSLLASAPLHAQSRVNPDHFFRSAPLAEKGLPDDLVYPIGKLFPFSFFSVGGGSEQKTNDLLPDAEREKAFEQYQAVGYKIFGPQYELKDRSLVDAEKYKMKVAYTLGQTINFHAKPSEVADPEAAYTEIAKQVTDVAKNRDIAFWYLQPEELRPWRKNEMEYLAAASKAVRESDPLKRPLWIYDPAHANAKRMASIAPHVDYVGKGMYPNYVSMGKNRIWCRWTIEEQIEAIKLSGAKAIPIAVPEMFVQPSEEDLPKIPTWVRHDVYLSLASGAKGVMVFSARQRPKFAARNAYLAAYNEVYKELTGPRNLAEVFLFGEKRSDLSVDITDGPKELQLLYPSGGVKEPLTYPSVTSLDVAYGNDRYVFLVNSSEEKVTVNVGGMPYAAVKAESVTGKELVFDIGEGEFEVELAPLEAKGFKLIRR